MNEEKQVCGKGYSEELIKLGVKKKSYFCWVKGKYSQEDEVLSHCDKDTCEWACEVCNCIPAYVFGELSEMLPFKIIRNDRTEYLAINKGCNFWTVFYVESGVGRVPKENYYEVRERLSNAGAKMLIRLLEDKIITVEEINK